MPSELAPKPSVYILELCDTSGHHGPVARFVSATPFHCVSIGDRFDDTGWARLDGKTIASAEQPVRYKVHSIKHLIVETDGQNIVRYQLNLEPYSGPSSPVWPN